MNGQEKQGQWWIKVPAGQFGPVDVETVRAWVEQRRITPNDFVHNPELNAWVPASNVPQLAGLFPSGSARAPFPAAPPQAEKKGINVGCLIAALVGGVVVIVFLAGLLLPALARAREMARRASCLSNIKQIGLAMDQYAQDFSDAYPWREGRSDPDEAWRDLGMLYPNYNTAIKSFLCPSSDDRLFIPKTSDGGGLRENPLNSLAGGNTKEVISYGYCYARARRGPRPWGKGDRYNVRLLADKKAGTELTDGSNHRTDGRNVLYHDGHVRWKAGPMPLDPDETEDRIGKPGARDYVDWWSDPPYYGE